MWILAILLFLAAQSCVPEPEPEFFRSDHVIVVGPRQKVAEVIERVEIEVVERADPLPTVEFIPDSTEVVSTGAPGLGSPTDSVGPPSPPFLVSPRVPKLSLQSRISVPHLNSELILACSELSFLPDESDYTLDLYKVISGTAEDLIRQINDIGQPVGVYADPNYFTGRPPAPVEGDPWSIGADPWSIGADPWSIGADPWSIGADPWSIGADPWSIGAYPLNFDLSTYTGGDRPAARAAFRKQWALNEVSTGGIQANGISQDQLDRGTAQVGVFDTSPFPFKVELSQAAIDWPRPSFSMKVDHLEVPDISDHGLFVSGLIKGVAPLANVHLYRVLNDGGQGHLYTLLVALTQFSYDVVKSNRDSASGNAVINLSMGVHKPPGDASLPDDIITLKTILAAAHCNGILTVAAAGNDSNTSNAMESQIPAAWDFVLGVASSNTMMERSCFSNNGDVAAPGGDGGQGELSSGELSDCVPRVKTCYNASVRVGADKFCVISIIHPVEIIRLGSSSPIGETSGYTYWTGTSFSTPLVSGLAALTYGAIADQNIVPSQIPSGEAISRGVRNRIINCAYVTNPSNPSSGSLSIPVINVPRTLLGFCQPIYVPLQPFPGP